MEVTFFIVFFTGAIVAYLGFVNEKKAGGSIIPSWLMHATANILSGLVSAFSLLLVDKVIKMELVEIPAFFQKINQKFFSYFINISYFDFIIVLQIWR
ncbi:hypothetical protein [Streptococcus sp. Marseille-Q5986]|uniref:hypothetical protein n=1 Tax=Streptococcus sp. Marseille-Q5986 TaxID=2972782 RepID=UPI0022655848|nr:hypothetical protein [Streptococcus sp. Marseille-Q5986]